LFAFCADQANFGRGYFGIEALRFFLSDVVSPKN
jgi:hypothetical protein